jgi:hypothetical protein
MDLSKSYFLGSDVSKTRFDSCHWIEPEEKEKYQKVAEHDTIIKEFEDAKKSWKTEEINKAPERLILLRSLYRQLELQKAFVLSTGFCAVFWSLSRL